MYVVAKGGATVTLSTCPEGAIEIMTEALPVGSPLLWQPAAFAKPGVSAFSAASRSNRAVGRCFAAACANLLAKPDDKSLALDALLFGSDACAACVAECAISSGNAEPLGEALRSAVSAASPPRQESAAIIAAVNTRPPRIANGSHFGNFGRIFVSAAMSEGRGANEEVGRDSCEGMAATAAKAGAVSAGGGNVTGFAIGLSGLVLTGSGGGEAADGAE